MDKLYFSLGIYFLLSFGPFFCNSIPVGETCNDNSDCDGYPESTVCEDFMGVCYCNDLHIPVIGPPITCEKIHDKIGEPCKDPAQCTQGTPGKLSDCIPSLVDPDQLICNCTEGNIHQPGEHVCHEIRNLIGDPCQVHAQCSFHLSEWGECEDHKCSCRKPGSVETIDHDKCLPVRYELYLDCEIPEQCTIGTPGRYSNCTERFDDENEDPTGKICNCTEIAINEPNFHQCYLRRDELGQQCDVNAQCRVNMGDLSECKDKTSCACIENEAVGNIENSFCLEVINDIGKECIEDQQCTEGEPGNLSKCLPSFEDKAKLVCNCTEEAINEPGKNECHRKAEYVADLCVEEAQCTANLGDLAECYFEDTLNPGYCKCKDGTIPRDNGTLCLAIRQHLGETCEENRQCQSGVPGQHSICEEGKCACNLEATNEPGQDVCLERADIIGGGCQANMQCKANLGPLSECLGGQCSCTVDYAVGNQHGNFCIPVINFIGGDCQEDVQCRKGEPGKYSDCLPSNILPGSNICNCTVGAVHQIGRHKCYKVADKIGEDCDVVEQCQIKLGKLAVCLGEDQGCQCVDGEAIGNKEGDKCLEIIDKIGENCEENGQCVSGAPGDLSECGKNDDYPYDNICKCLDTAIKHPTNEECLVKAINVGDRCAVGLQCTVNIGNLTECDNGGFCKCLDGAVANAEGIRDTKCIPGGILIGNGCFDKAQCVGEMDVTSTCSIGVCGCLEGYTESMKLDNCLVIRDRLGDECQEPQQCQQGDPGELSECRENEMGGGKGCRCSENATSEAGRHVCYPKAMKIGDSCEKNVQCVASLGQSQCLRGRCVCMEDSVGSENGDRCLSKVDLNQACEDNNQCRHMDHVTCQKRDEEEKIDEMICRCDSGYIENPGKPNSCMRKAALVGDTCEDHPSQCSFLGGATCHADLEPPVCQCDAMEEVVGGDGKTCLEAVHDLYESCYENVQCQVVNSICSFYTAINHTACICDNGFVETSNGKCLPMRNEIGQTCEDTRQCQGIGLNVECILNGCRCKEPFDDYANKCYIPAKLGANCDTSQQCYLGVNEFALCNISSGRCTCVERAYEFRESCLEPKIVGDTCEMDVECTNTIIGPVYCSRLSSRCSCQDGYKPDTGDIRCSSAYSVVSMGGKSVVFLVALIWSVSQSFY